MAEPSETGTPDPTLFAALDATWPAAEMRASGPFLLRRGEGGGKRVSAASATGPATASEIDAAIAAMRGLGQRPVFRLAAAEHELDVALAERDFTISDPVQVWSSATETLCDRPLPRVTAFAIWEPLAIMSEIWDAGGIGPARQAVMARAEGPRTGIFGRVRDMPAGAAFAACHERTAMVHALEIRPAARRLGLGGWMMRCAAFWARGAGADRIAVLCRTDCRPAMAFYDALGFTPAGRLHFRVAPA